MTRLAFLPEPFIRIALGHRSDLGAYVIAGIHNEVARVWKVNADDTDGGELKFTGGAGKDDSLDVAIGDDGSVMLVVSEASGAGAGGATSEPAVYRFPGVFPPCTSGGETYVSAPGGYIRALGVTRNDPPFKGSHTITLPDSIPQGVVGLQLRIMSAGATVGAALYVGANSNIAGAITVYAIVAGARSTVEGRRGVGANHTIFASASSDLVEVYIDVMGWWY